MPPESAKNVRAKLFLKMGLRGETVRSVPQRLEIFGIRFPAAQVLAEVEAQRTTFPLQALPANLTYQRVAVLPTRWRSTSRGRT